MPFIEENDLLKLHKLIDKRDEELDIANDNILTEREKFNYQFKINIGLVIVILLLICTTLYGFFIYKKTSNPVSVLTEKIIEEERGRSNTTTNEVVRLNYGVQIGAFKTFNISNIKENSLITKVKNDEFFTYNIGVFKTYSEALDLKLEIKKLGFKEAFIVAINNGEKIDICEALELSNEQQYLE